MSRPILTKSDPVLLLGAGPTSAGLVNNLYHLAKTVVAVDGGLHAADAAGLVPDIVIGDFDSIDAARLENIPTHQRVTAPDQNLTDFDKALSVIKAPIILAAGFLGGRLDHQLAAFSSLLRTDLPVILVDENNLVFVVPSHLDMPLPHGSSVALYPFVDCRVETNGLKYDVKDAAMAPNGLISTSNEMRSDRLEIWTNGRGLLGIIPRSALDHLVLALHAP